MYCEELPLNFHLQHRYLLHSLYGKIEGKYKRISYIFSKISLPHPYQLSKLSNIVHTLMVSKNLAYIRFLYETHSTAVFLTVC